jgi:hypothetical protein
MAVRFPHANNFSISEDEFRAAWTWLHLEYGDAAVGPNELPILQTHSGFDTLVSKSYQLSLDYLCRLLVPASYRNGTQGSKEFVAANPLLLAPTPSVVNPKTGKLVEGVQLVAPYEIISVAIEKLFSAAEDEAGVAPFVQADVPVAMTGVLGPLDRAAWRHGRDFVRQFVEDVARDPFIAHYRKKPRPGPPAIGWDARLDDYFWPRPEVDRHATVAALAPIVASFTPLSSAVQHGTPWTPAQDIAAHKAAMDVFTWGKVPQDPSSVHAANIRQVIEAAWNDDAFSSAPMNSGWTKVATLATGDLHVIWDSRVSTSVVRRLDRLMQAANITTLARPYCFVGLVNVGRGGGRPIHSGTLALRWPNGYQSWLAQVAGSAFVRCVRDEINTGRWTARSRPWTLCDVEMVLFMDGY